MIIIKKSKGVPEKLSFNVYSKKLDRS